MYDITKSLPKAFENSIVLAVYDIGQEIRNDDTILTKNKKLVILESSFDNFLAEVESKIVDMDDCIFVPLSALLHDVEHGFLYPFELPFLAAEYKVPEFSAVTEELRRTFDSIENDKKIRPMKVRFFYSFYYYQVYMYKKTGAIVSEIPEGTVLTDTMLKSTDCVFTSLFNLHLRNILVDVRKKIWKIRLKK